MHTTTRSVPGQAVFLSRGKVLARDAATPDPASARSEPEHFIEFASRIPQWCVVVGLVGSGQEIHAGEEGGLGQWRHALEGCGDPAAWTVHGPPTVAGVFSGSGVRADWTPALDLGTEIRFHLASRLHEMVEILLERGSADEAAPIAEELHRGGLRFYLTRDLEAARRHARERYAGAPEARYGLLASSKDKDLPRRQTPACRPLVQRPAGRPRVLLPPRYRGDRVFCAGAGIGPCHSRVGVGLPACRRAMVDRARRTNQIRA